MIHTLGPWKHDNMTTQEMEFHILTENKQLIAVVPCVTTFREDIERAHDNAALIAAAPAMYEAANALVQFLAENDERWADNQFVLDLKEALRLVEGRG